MIKDTKNNTTTNLILRLDDVGGSLNENLENYRYQKLTEKDWDSIIEVLEKNKAKLVVFYIPGWVDSNKENTQLFIEGKLIENRECGTIYDSKDVYYIDDDGITDLRSEYEGLKRGIEQGVIEIQSHGYTHLTPYLDEWCNAKDKFTNKKWYKEFKDEVHNREMPIEEQRRALRKSTNKIKEFFEIAPTILVPSNNEFSINTKEIAQEFNLELYDIETTFITSPSNKFKDNELIGASLHDYDLKDKGSSWFDRLIWSWKRKGYSIVTFK